MMAENVDHQTAPGAPPVNGSCGLCGRQCVKVDKQRFGRRVTSLEEPLRATVAGLDVVCDVCLVKKQPLRRTDKQWARELKDRAPLCARNGWCCPLQVQETKLGKKKHTETLLPDGLNEHYREKMGIRHYAAVKSVCTLCYKEFSKCKRPVAQPTTPSAAASPPELSTGTLKRAWEPRESVTETDLVEALAQCPDFVRSRIAALIARDRPDVNSSGVRKLLGVSKCGTYDRAVRELALGGDPQEMRSRTGWGEAGVCAGLEILQISF